MEYVDYAAALREIGETPGIAHLFKAFAWPKSGSSTAAVPALPIRTPEERMAAFAHLKRARDRQAQAQR